MTYSTFCRPYRYIFADHTNYTLLPIIPITYFLPTTYIIFIFVDHTDHTLLPTKPIVHFVDHTDDVVQKLPTITSILFHLPCFFALAGATPPGERVRGASGDDPILCPRCHDGPQSSYGRLRNYNRRY